jgi:hypothetical protein
MNAWKLNLYISTGRYKITGTSLAGAIAKTIRLKLKIKL